MKKTVVLYPGLAVGHLNPMIELADVFLDHGYAVAVALIDPSVMENEANLAAAVVIDASCAHAHEASRNLGVPVLMFYPSNAGHLAVNLQAPLLVDGFKKHLGGDSTSPVEFLGVRPMSASHLAGLLGPISEVNKDFEAMIFAGARMKAEFDGILINTSVSLEERALRALADPRCCPDGVVIPPVRRGATGRQSRRRRR